MCHRFLEDMQNQKYDFDPKDAEFVIQIIEKTFVHQKGEDMKGYPLRGKPFYCNRGKNLSFITYSRFFTREPSSESTKRHLSCWHVKMEKLLL